MNKIFVYIFVICFALSLLANIGLNFTYYALDETNENFKQVEIAFMVVNALMILLVIALIGMIFWANVCNAPCAYD